MLRRRDRDDVLKELEGFVPLGAADLLGRIPALERLLEIVPRNVRLGARSDA